MWVLFVCTYAVLNASSDEDLHLSNTSPPAPQVLKSEILGAEKRYNDTPPASISSARLSMGRNSKATGSGGKAVAVLSDDDDEDTPLISRIQAPASAKGMPKPRKVFDSSGGDDDDDDGRSEMGVAAQGPKTGFPPALATPEQKPKKVLNSSGEDEDDRRMRTSSRQAKSLDIAVQTRGGLDTTPLSSMTASKRPRRLSAKKFLEQKVVISSSGGEDGKEEYDSSPSEEWKEDGAPSEVCLFLYST